MAAQDAAVPARDSAAHPYGELASGVFWIAQSVLDGKNGVVLGRRAALAIDSGNSPADGAAVSGLIRRRGHTPDRLALTHGHGDHVVGSSAFPGAEVFAHYRTPDVVRRHLPNLVRQHRRPDLAAVRSRVRELAGRSAPPEAIVGACPHADFVGGRFAAINPRGEAPRRLTVAKIVAEVRAERRPAGDQAR